MSKYVNLALLRVECNYVGNLAVFGYVEAGKLSQKRFGRLPGHKIKSGYLHKGHRSKNMEKIPEHGACFVCGTENPHSMGVDWYQKEDGSIHADMVFSIAHQGPPSHVHGGASAAVLDEAMGAAVWRAGYIVVAVNLEINYKKPVPLGQIIVIEARIAEVHPRKILTTSEMRLPDGSVAVTGRGIYVEAPHLFIDGGFG